MDIGICSWRNVSDSDVWFVYLLTCSDDTLYCGITNNLEKRLTIHNSGKGAKYTRSRLPVSLLKSFKAESKSIALKIERKIKKLSRKQKLELQSIKHMLE